MNILQRIKSKILSYIYQAIEDAYDNDIEFKESPKTKTAESANKNTTTDELISRLRDIANDPTEYAVKKGAIAMCYCPSPEARQLVTYECVKCNRKLGEMPNMYYSPIVDYSRRIKSFGIAQVKIVCADCLIEMCLSGKYRYNIKEWDNYEQMLSIYKVLSATASEKSSQLSDIDDIDILKSLTIKASGETKDEYFIVLIFKPKDVDTPHLTVTYSGMLEYLLAFFNNCRKWDDGDNTTLLRDNIDTIERLTGLKL